MIFTETIHELISKDLLESNSELNTDYLKECLEYYCKDVDLIQSLLKKLSTKVQKEYKEFAKINDLSQDWIIDEFGSDNYNISLQMLINNRIDRENLHVSIDLKKEMFLIEYENHILENPDFMQIDYYIKENYLV